jgi:hypothetical protein
MACTSKTLQTVDNAHLNRHLDYLYAGPTINFVDLQITPQIGRRMQILSHFVECINNLGEYPLDCVVPTPETELVFKQGRSNRLVRGMRMKNTTHAVSRELKLVSAARSDEKWLKSFNRATDSTTATAAAAATATTADRGFVETQMVRMVIRLFPVVHPSFKGIGRVISLVGLPGVNIAKCIQRVCDPRFYDTRHGDVGRSREGLWRELVNSEFGVMENVMRHDDMEGRLCDLDNYEDLDHHIYHFCSETMIVKKLLIHAERHLNSTGFDGATELWKIHMPGLANPCDERNAPGSKECNRDTYDTALTAESASILTWVKAFNVCRTHQLSEAATSGREKAQDRKDNIDEADEGLDTAKGGAAIQGAGRALAEATELTGRLEYYLPSILRPLINTTDLPDIDPDRPPPPPSPPPPLLEHPAESMDIDDADHDHNGIPRDGRFYGFQEAAITLVCRPVVSEDFFLEFKGYDMGSFPPLVRIVLLDFVIGNSDPDVAECVLSEADLVPLTTLGRQQRFYSTAANCMDTYIRQDVFSSWKAGFVKHQTTMASTYAAEAAEKPWRLVALLQEKAAFYAKQAIQFHCSNIQDGIYRSEIVSHIFDVYTQLKTKLNGRLKHNLSTFGVGSEVGCSVRASEWNSLDSAAQMRLLFYRAMLDFNLKAHMSYTNIAIVNELFTTSIQWFIHPGNETWSSWLIPIQVVPQKAHLYRVYHKDGSKAICVDKPNSTGVDEIACRAYEGMMLMIAWCVTRSDGRAVDLSMAKAGRETPCARERRNKTMISRNTIYTEPDPSLMNRMQSSTEERNLGDADLDAKIRVTPRNRMTIRDGTVFTTDTNEKGSRESQRWEPVGGYHVALQATNCQITSARNQEQWETNLIGTKCMSTGRDVDKTRKRTHRGDFTVNHASGSSQGIRDPVKARELSTLLCVLPHLTGSFICYMNRLGLTSMEIAPLVTSYMNWSSWRFETLFGKLIGKRLDKSFQRTTMGHIGRHVSDYALARLTIEATKTEDFDTAMACTLNVLQYSCLPVSAVPTWIDDAVRETVDGQLLVFHTVFSPMLEVPHVSLAWLCKALLPYDILSKDEQEWMDGHADALALAKWIKSLVDKDCFVYEQDNTTLSTLDGVVPGGHAETLLIKNGAKKPLPYVTTRARAPDAASFLRTHTKHLNHSETIARRLVKNKTVVEYSKNTGFTVDEPVMKCMLDRCLVLRLSLGDVFGCDHLCDPEIMFALARRVLKTPVESPFAKGVDAADPKTFDDPPYATLVQVNCADGADIMYGVNMTLAVIMTSLCGGNGTPNSQIDERVVKSVMRLMMRDMPAQFLGQNGDTYLRKNFRGNNPQCDFNNVDVFGAHRPAYIVRPVHDHSKASGTLTHFPCDVYGNYAPEDLAHMNELATLASTYNTPHVTHLSLAHCTPRYMLCYNVVYPVAFTKEGVAKEGERVDGHRDEIRGYLMLPDNGNGSAVSWKLRYYGAAAYHNASGSVWELDEALAARNTVVLPLIKRHGAVVLHEGSFGVVLPVAETRTSIPDDTFLHNLIEERWGYDVLFENCGGKTSLIDALAMDALILPLASRMWLRIDVYNASMGIDGNHSESVSTNDSATGGDTTPDDMLYVSAVISYPLSYPSNDDLCDSFWVEIAYGQNGSSGDDYVPIEINLRKLEEAQIYTKNAWGPPLSHIDPRTMPGGEGVKVVAFTMTRR